LLIIAEAGANHNRNFEQAIALVNVARKAGADICKFQTYSSDTLYAKNTSDFAKYHDVNELIRSLEMPREWLADLKAYCDDVGIEFMSTPFDEKAVEELVSLGVKRLKVAGFESTDPRFLQVAASAQLPLIVSAGIGTSVERIETILEIASIHGCGDVSVLHCNNAYPTPQDDIKLDTIAFYRERFGVPVGLSDHTESIVTPALAVMVGAELIEKHFTLSRLIPGPDHPFALEPDELQQMVETINVARHSKGVRGEEYSNSEKDFSPAMRSVVATEAIHAGSTLTTQNTTTKRPYLPGAVPAENYFEVLGRIAGVDIGVDEIVFRENVS